MPTGESLLGVIAEAFPEAVLIFSPAGRLQAVNTAAVRLTGLEAKSVDTVTLAELLEDPATAATVVAGAAEPAELTGGGSQPIPGVFRLYGAGCGCRWFRGESWRLVIEGKTKVCLRLFTSQADQLRGVLMRIASGLVASRDLPAAECRAAGLAAAIAEVCAFTGWAYAEAWVPGAAGAPGQAERQWTPHPFWYGDRKRYQSFRDLSVEAAAKAPLPLITRVAQEQSSSWYSDVSVVPLAVYRRARAAREAGLKATFAQPIVEAGRTLAVLVFMMAEARARDDSLATLMGAVARQLVPPFRASAGEAAQLTTATPRPLPGAKCRTEEVTSLAPLCRLLESLEKPALITDHADAIIVWANAAACGIFGFECEAISGIAAARLHVDMPSFDDFAQQALRHMKTGKPFRYRSRMVSQDGSRFVAEHLVVPLAEVAGRRLSVSVVSDLSQSARSAFGRRLDQLSAREQDVFHLTVVGATVTEIAARLQLSARTVEAHRSHLLRKLGCASTNKLLADLLAESLADGARL